MTTDLFESEDGRTRYVFASLDESLRHIARLVFGTEQNTTEQNDLAGALFSRMNEPNRQIHRQQTLELIDEMIVKGEAELFDLAADLSCLSQTEHSDAHE